MPERPNPDPTPSAPDHADIDTDDLGYRDNEEDRAYERAQPDGQPPISSDPEPDAEPADAG
jgi:hypothetical protein